MEIAGEKATAGEGIESKAPSVVGGAGGHKSSTNDGSQQVGRRV